MLCWQQATEINNNEGTLNDSYLASQFLPVIVVWRKYFLFESTVAEKDDNQETKAEKDDTLETKVPDNDEKVVKVTRPQGRSIHLTQSI